MNTPQNKIRIGIECLDHCFHGDPGHMARQAARYLEGTDFDTMAGIGMSGAMVIPELARTLSKDFIMVRKPGDAHRHHGSNVRAQGTLGRRWILVDDGIVTGSSLARVHRVISDYAAQAGFDTEFAGAYFYGHGDDPPQFYSPRTLRSHGLM